MEKKALARTLGNLVQRLRLERGYSQETFAQACGLERTHVGKIERGEINITVATSIQLIDGLDKSISGFFSDLERELARDSGTNT